MAHTKTEHRSEVAGFLQKIFPGQSWLISLPPSGTGNETYFAYREGRSYFIKLGAHIERYEAMANLGLAPQIITTEYLEDGISIMVQQKIEGRKPSRKDFHRHLEQFAQIIKTAHCSERLLQALPQKNSEYHRDAGLEMLAQIERRWQAYRPLTALAAGFVDASIDRLRHEINQFQGAGLVASHGDICNGNWLVSTDENIYLIDYESMSLDDPALDLGAILWWYYPPNMRARFLCIAGYEDNEGLRNRMRIRMAMHCLHIILPRENSFDKFHAEMFAQALEDFQAVFDGKENPQGYE